MRPALRAPAPSSALLQYLKTQSDAACFYIPNSHPGLTGPGTHARDSYSHSTRSYEIPRTISRQEAPGVALPPVAKRSKGFLRTSRLQHLYQCSSIQCRNSLIGRDLGARSVPSGQRNGSTWAKPWLWMDKLRHRVRRGEGGKLRPDDLPRGREDSTETSVFSLGRVVSAKAAAQPKVRCTELDEYGNVTLASGEFKKSELIAKVRYLYRIGLDSMLKRFLITVWTPPTRSSEN
jgi:magnesium transporter